MYIPKPFAVEEKALIERFLQHNTFGQLVSKVNGQLFSTQLPFLYQPEKNIFLCHVAKQNPQWQDIENQELLITIEGPHEYISPTWYEAKGGVPTWNYQAVHAYGAGKLITDPESLQALVEELSDVYEGSKPEPWQPQYNPAMLKAIVGIEITVTELQCTFKLSQNRSQQDQNQIIEELIQQGAQKLANAMKATRK